MTAVLARRTLLAATALAPAAALIGCAGGSGLSQVVTDINLVLAGLQKLLPFLSGVPLPAGITLAQIQTWLADAQAAAAGLATTPTSGTFAQQFFAAVENILGVVAGLGVIPAPFNLIVSALVVLLPVIASALGVPAPAVVDKLTARVMTRIVPLTPAQARAILSQ